MSQFDLFTTFKGLTVTTEGEANALIGMKKAIDHANEVHKGWEDQAFQLLTDFVKTNNVQFMAEEVREYAHKRGLPRPPSNRAFGPIMQRAARAGMIQCTGYKKVKNPKAHNANAAVWRRVR